MHAESVFSKYDYNDEKVALAIGTLIELPHGIALVATTQGKVIGGFLGRIDKHWFGDDLQAYDLALFILPEHRGSTAAYKLIREYIARAKAFGAAQISIANSTGFEPKRVKRLFEVTGFDHVGYVMEYVK